MFNTTEEQKNKYRALIEGVFSKYNQIVTSVNNECKKYGADFYGFTTGKITLEYINDSKLKTKEGIIKIEQQVFTSMIDELVKIKERYVDECFPITETKDTVELDFIGKELAVMSYDELEQFYKINFADKNKVRLFDIEIRRRKISDNKVFNADAIKLDTLREEYSFKDKLTNTIDEKIKYIDGARQILTGTLVLFKDAALQEPRVISFNTLFDFIEGRSRYSVPKEIDVNDLI